VVAADPLIITSDERPVLLDEWQRLPNVWDVVRRSVDADASGGQYLLTGSAPTQGTHSGAGRIVSVRMRPLVLGERRDLSPTVSLSALLAGVDDVVTGSTTVGLTVSVGEIVAGGFPGPRHLEGRALTAQLDGYLSRIVTREFADAGHRRAPPGDAHWLVAGLRGSHGDYCSVGDHPRRRHRRVGHQAGPEHLDRLLGRVDGAGILDPTPAWSPSRNHLARLAASPKHHLADPALAVRLLRRDHTQLLRGDERGLPIPRSGKLLGALFESLAALSVRTYGERADADVSHMRTSGGHREIDFITTGQHAYRRRDGIAVVPLALLGP